MLRTLLIFLLSLIVAIGSTVMMYQEEVDTMIAIGQQKFDEIVNGKEPETEKPSVETEAKLESIAVDTTAAKLEFAFGEKFSTEGLKVIATYKDGSKKEIALEDCKLMKPDTAKPGTRQVTVVYEGFTARYNVTVNLKVIPPISTTPLVEIAENDKSYRVEAELIDMVTPGAVKAEGVESFVATAPEGADATSGNKYLTGYGVAWNYFGFTFTTAEEYKETTLVLRVANSTAADINAGVVKMYLNFSQDENGVASGEIPLEGYIIEANEEFKWSEIVIRNVTLPKGTNTLTFEVQDKDSAFEIDYIDLYVGMPYVKSIVEITDTTTVVKDLETLDTEKAFTRSDVANAHNLKDGQLFVENVSKPIEGQTTSGGTSVGAIGKGSQISTYIHVTEDSTVRIKFKASAVGKGAYYVSDNWNFYIDGVKLDTVEYVNIEGGDSSKGYWWDWKYTNVGDINLTAGYHLFTLEVHGTDCNVDTVEFEAISIGSFAESGKDLEDMQKPEEDDNSVKVEIDKKGEYVVEGEDFDQTNLTPTADWVDKGGIQIETVNQATPATSGGKSLGACGGGYTTITFTLKDKATVQILGRLAHAHGGTASKYMSVKLGETELATTAELPKGDSATSQYWNWADVPFGSEMELEAGTYTITITYNSNPNVDCFKINVISYGDEEAHDVEITDAKDEYKVEAEDLSIDNLVPQENFEEPKVESFTGGAGLGGIAGGYQTFSVVTDKDVKVALSIRFAKYEGGKILSFITGVSVNDQALTLTDGDVAPGTSENQWWNVSTVRVATVELKAGTVYTFKIGVACGNLDGYTLTVIGCEHTNTTAIGEAKAADCNNAGITAGVKCADCGETITAQEVIPAKGHTAAAAVEENRVESTCIKAGSYDSVVYCSVCKTHEMSRETKALELAEHEYDTTTWGYQAADGHAHYCKTKGCTAKDTVVGHTSSGAATEEAAETCTVCNYVINPKLNHVCNFATVEYNDAQHWGKCSCGKTNTAVDHTFTNYVSNNNATCTADGTETAKCEGCEKTHTQTEADSMLDHVYTTYESNGDATCTADGTKTATCDLCDTAKNTVADTGSATGHTEEIIPAVAATSATTGLTEGKKCTTCGTVTVEQSVTPILKVTINATGEYVFEAENLDFTNLKPSSGWESRGVQIETVNQATPLTSGGKSVGACGGGYSTITFVLEQKATIHIYGRLAFAHGGAASDFMSVSLGGSDLVAIGDLPEGDSNSQYFNWADIPFGAALDLEAGEYTITITYKSNPNLDCFKIKALSYGEFKCYSTCKYCDLCNNADCAEAGHETKCSCPTVDAEISLTDKVVTVEAENFDNSGVVTRQDMIDAGRLQAGQYGVETKNHATAIWGFTSGTTFTLHIYANSAMDVDMLLVGATDQAGYDVSTKFSLNVNGAAATIPSGILTGTQQNEDVAAYHDWRIVNLGRISLNKGFNTIVLTINDGHPNIDCIKFASTTIADVDVATSGTTNLKINNTFDFSRSMIHARIDVLNATKVIGKLTGNANQTWAPADGSTFRIYVNVQAPCKLQICPTSAAGATEDQLKAQSYYFDGVAMDYNGTVEVTEAGVYVFEFTCVVGGNYSGVNFTVVE